MNKNRRPKFDWNAGTGMIAGILIGAMVALAVRVITGDQSTWLWAIPFGLATGLAIGAGKENRSNRA